MYRCYSIYGSYLINGSYSIYRSYSVYRATRFYGSSTIYDLLTGETYLRDLRELFIHTVGFVNWSLFFTIPLNATLRLVLCALCQNKAIFKIDSSSDMERFSHCEGGSERALPWRPLLRVLPTVVAAVTGGCRVLGRERAGGAAGGGGDGRLSAVAGRRPGSAPAAAVTVIPAAAAHRRWVANKIPAQTTTEFRVFIANINRYKLLN